MSRILIADDEQDSQVLLRELLEAAGHQIRTAGDGLKALELARGWLPDLVIADVLMPGIDGFRLCQELRRDPALGHVPVVFYSANYTDADDAALGDELGAARYLVKPLTPGRLLEEIQAVLRESPGRRTAAPSGTGPVDSARLERLHAEALARKLEQKVAELAREQSARAQTEERLRLALLGANDGIWDWNLDTREVYFSPRWKGMLGYGEEELSDGLDSFDRLVHPEDAPALWAAVNDYLEGHNDRFETEYRLQHKDGRYVDVLSRGFALRDADGRPYRMVGTHVDISQRKRDEEELRRLNRIYTLLSACNHALSRATGMEVLLQQFCNDVVGLGGYRFAWIGVMETRNGELLRVAAQAGDSGGFLDLEDKAGFGNGLAHEALGQRRIVVVNDVATDPAAGRCRPRALASGFAAGIALPLVHQDAVCGVLSICAAEADVFGDQEVSLLGELADDLAFGIQSQRAEAARRRAEETLRLRERAIEAASNGVLITDARERDRPIVYANPAFLRITGYAREDVMGANPRFLFAGELDQPGLDEIRAALRQRTAATVTVRNYRKDGSPFWNEMRVAPVLDDQGVLTHYVGILNDVSERVSYERQLERQANYDAVTGVANRNRLMNRLEQALSQAERLKARLALLFIDLDRFKQINDTLGHAAGDLFLREVAQRLVARVRKGDTVARLSGDEFVVILTEVGGEEAALAVAEGLRQALATPFEIDGREVAGACSIGLALYPRDGVSGEELIRKADVAMYAVKMRGGDAHRIYRPELSERVSSRLSTESGLRRAIERGELSLAYQPQVRLADGRTVGAEALLRWRSRELGDMVPARFIPVAEDTGLIVPIGAWVLREACRQLREWRDAGLGIARISVNLSGVQIQRGDIVAEVRTAVESAGIEPSALELEVTEGFVMEYNERAARAINELHRIGVSLAVDDFGTGYSSLSYLKRLPVHALKIDQSFVRDIGRDRNSEAITRAVIALGHSLGLSVVAEGVEQEDQRAYLLAQGCHYGQGYLFSRPLSVDDFTAYLDGGEGSKAVNAVGDPVG